MPWLNRLRKAEKIVAKETADPAARLAVLAEQQAELAKTLSEIVEQLRRERAHRD